MDVEPPPLPAPPAARPRPAVWALLGGFLTGLLAAAALGAPLLYYAYRTGKSRGAASERERVFSKEEAIAPAPIQPFPLPGHPSGLLEGADGKDLGEMRTDVPAPLADAAGAESFCFSALDCVRVVWPMELVPRSAALDHPHLRIRQGANRLARPETGLCEFAFRLHRAGYVVVYVHARYSDDCGNSLRYGVDGSPLTFLGGTKVYDQWLWEHGARRLNLAPGLHRLLLQTSEDGLEFDKVAIVDRPASPEELDGLAVTPPPTFERLPAAGPAQPELNAVTAQAFATESLVIGAGHRNALTVHVRLNGLQAVAGYVEVRSPRARFSDTRTFNLDADHRTALLSWDLDLRLSWGYFVPVEVRVLTPRGCAHAQRLDFIRPLSWAFLGPFPDPNQKGLNQLLAPDLRIADLPSRPAFPGVTWRILEDGSCYDEFGLVDFNQVYGIRNDRWLSNPRPRPAIAYAVTALRTGGSHHMSLAFAGDDCVLAWLNGKCVLRQDGNAPIETSRMVVGVQTAPGTSYFVFKVPQTILYWQLLFEPDAILPYSHADSFQPLPVAAWGQGE